MTIEQESTPPLPVMAATFDEFHAATSRRTLALAYALTGNWGDAEDLVQDAYLAASRKWDELARYDDPSSWVRRVVLTSIGCDQRSTPLPLTGLITLSLRWWTDPCRGTSKVRVGMPK